VFKYTSESVVFTSIFKQKRDTLLVNYKILSTIHSYLLTHSMEQGPS